MFDAVEERGSVAVAGIHINPGSYRQRGEGRELEWGYRWDCVRMFWGAVGDLLVRISLFNE